MSEGEALFALHARSAKLPASEREFRFDPARRWRFDFAWPDHRVALEIEGGTWTAGRHTRGKGFEADCEKYSAAAIYGWCVIRATTSQVRAGHALDWVKEALARRTVDNFHE